ncbi:MAG: phosphopantothenoylcysteine decarboxylase [Candidatus Aminicenantes bacterium]|jgi:phosphopantothenoylcysteine decarboxylase/phosphopantothenate--cysteine ligase
MFKRVIITSGPTIEPIDPVRYISNRSSGRSGLHLAHEAVKRGIAEIIFITGPTCMSPQGVTIILVETALEMRSQLQRYENDADVIIMAAAVGDYRVANYFPQKIKKDQETLTLQLVKNPDLLFELGQKKKPHQVLVGYAAETHNIFQHARQKFEKKNLDLLVLNEVSSENPAFNNEENQVYLFTSAGMRKLDKMEKSVLAVHIWDEVYRIIKVKVEEEKSKG